MLWGVLFDAGTQRFAPHVDVERRVGDRATFPCSRTTCHNPRFFSLRCFLRVVSGAWSRRTSGSSMKLCGGPAIKRVMISKGKLTKGTIEPMVFPSSLSSYRTNILGDGDAFGPALGRRHDSFLLRKHEVNSNVAALEKGTAFQGETYGDAMHANQEPCRPRFPWRKPERSPESTQ